MLKNDSVLYMVELNSVLEEPKTEESIPPEIQAIISQYQSIFEPLPSLPPQREKNHTIPLLPGAQPFRLRPYRYNPFQKDEIERQIKELLQKGLKPAQALLHHLLCLSRRKLGIGDCV